jgi:hypothetical protein
MSARWAYYLYCEPTAILAWMWWENIESAN